MIACISLLIPPLMLSYMRKKILNKYESIYESIVNYIFCLLALNFLVMLILCYGFNSKDNLFFKLNQYNNFAIKYVLLSTLFAILEPNIEKVIREKISIDFNIKSIKIAETIQWKAILSIYATILFILNFIRIFDNNFWGDEAFTIGLIKNPIAKIVTGTASDVHPPLYYFIVRLAYVIFGNRGWVFHLVSLIPCFIILFLSLTVFWKQFGKEFSAILITLSCLSENAVVFNVEVRMYSWGSLFLLLSFYELYCILQIDNRRNYLLFALFSLAAAYTHYYCLIAVAFYYIVLLYLVFKRKYLNMRKVILCCTATVLGYLPWLVILVKSIKRVKDSYWINDIPTIKECVEYLFSNHFQPVVWGGIAIAGLMFILYETRILSVKKNEKGFLLRLTFDDASISENLIWMSAGIFSIVGTMMIGIIVSKVMRPVFLVRYLYPVSVVAWVLLGVIISRVKGRGLYTVLILLYLLTTCLPEYSTRYIDEKNMNEKLSRTLEVTVDEMGQNDVILTDNSHIAWTIADYYYPEKTNKQIDLLDFPELEKGINYWLIIESWNNMDELYGMFQEEGYFYKTIIKDGNLGGHQVSVYYMRR